MGRLLHVSCASVRRPYRRAGILVKGASVMPYRLTAEKALFRLVFIDELNAQDLVALAEAIAELERTRSVAPNRLIDLSQVADPQLTYAAMLDFVECRKAQWLPNRVKSAIVVSHSVQLGFARMFQILNDHPQIVVEIFPTMAEAEAWLASEA